MRAQMTQHAIALCILYQSLLAVAGDDGAHLTTINSLGGAQLGALRFNPARLLMCKAGFCHRDSVSHLMPARSQGYGG